MENNGRLETAGDGVTSAPNPNNSSGSFTREFYPREIIVNLRSHMSICRALAGRGLAYRVERRRMNER